MVERLEYRQVRITLSHKIPATPAIQRPEQIMVAKLKSLESGYFFVILISFEQLHVVLWKTAVQALSGAILKGVVSPRPHASKAKTYGSPSPNLALSKVT